MPLKQRFAPTISGGSLSSVPTEFKLSNYPDPFNPSTTITLLMPEAQYVTFKIFDLLGREITTLAIGEVFAGTHFVPRNAHDVSIGVYVAQRRTARFVKNIKMILMKQPVRPTLRATRTLSHHSLASPSFFL